MRVRPCLLVVIAHICPGNIPLIMPRIDYRIEIHFSNALLFVIIIYIEFMYTGKTHACKQFDKESTHCKF